MTRDDLLSVGIVGAGRITSTIHVPVLRNLPGARIAWVADRDQDRARQLAGQVGAEAVPSFDARPADLLLLAIPVPGREAVLRHHAAIGTAVLVEKPFANNLAEHEMLQSLFAPDKLGVGYQRRFYATARFVAEARASGWFGKLRRIVHREGGRPTRAGVSDYQDAPAAQGGGITKNLACHGIDLALHLSGAVTARVESKRVEWDGETDRRVAGTVAMEGPDGTVELDIVVTNLEGSDNLVTYEFDNATLVTAIQPQPTLRLSGSTGPFTIGLDHSGFARTSYQAFYLEWAEFAAGVREGRPSQIAAATSLLTTRVIDDLLKETAR